MQSYYVGWNRVELLDGRTQIGLTRFTGPMHRDIVQPLVGILKEMQKKNFGSQTYTLCLLQQTLVFKNTLMKQKGWFTSTLFSLLGFRFRSLSTFMISLHEKVKKMNRFEDGF